MDELADGGVNHPRGFFTHAIDVGDDDRDEFHTGHFGDRFAHQVRRQLARAVDVAARRVNIIRLKILVGFHLVDAGCIHHALAAHLGAQLDVVARQLDVRQLHIIIRACRPGCARPRQVEEAVIIRRGNLLRKGRHVLVQHADAGDARVIRQHIIKADIQCRDTAALCQQRIHQRFADKAVCTGNDYILHLMLLPTKMP